MKKTVFYKAAELIAMGKRHHNGRTLAYALEDSIFSCIAIDAILDSQYKNSPERKWYEDNILIDRYLVYDNNDERIIALLLADIIWREEH